MTESIKCFIYKSNKRDLLYLYTTAKENFSNIPEPLMKSFGNAEFVMELDLTAERQLAQAETAEVMGSLREKGFYLQMPPSDPWL